MRYSSTVVLSTLAIGSAAAAHNRHASFHARREASKRDDVDWSNVAYDLKDVDWSAINWKSVFSEPTPAAKQEPAPVAATPTPTPTPEPKKESAPSSKPAAATSSKESSNDGGLLDGVTDVVTDLLQGVAEISSKIGAKMGVNDESANGGLWIGGDGEFGMDVTNNGPDAMYTCWVKNGFSGMSVNVNAPAISVGIKSGQTVQISAAAGVSGACAPATDSTPKSNFGGVSNTWAEFTYPAAGKMGAFNVSKNVNMNGCSISMKGSTCTSDMNTCVFQCTGNVDSCVTGYELINCSASNGGGGGYDSIMQGTGGGCNMPDNAERLKVSFS